MVRKTKEEAERTYHLLLDAATRLFIRRGVARTTLNQIATEAGMTRGAVYWHFENKDAVIRSLWERGGNSLLVQLTEDLAQLDPAHPAASFRAAFRNMIGEVMNDPALAQAARIVMHSVEFTDEKTELQQFLVNRRAEFQAVLRNSLVELERRSALRGNLAPDLLAQALMGYLHGMVHYQLEPGSQGPDPEQVSGPLLDLILDAMLKPDA